MKYRLRDIIFCLLASIAPAIWSGSIFILIYHNEWIGYTLFIGYTIFLGWLAETVNNKTTPKNMNKEAR